MPTERQLQEVLRERSFREVFPWRNVTKAVLLLVAIAGIVVLKRKIDPLIKMTGDALSLPQPSQTSPAAPSSRR